MTPGEIDFIAERLKNMEGQLTTTRDTILLLVGEVSSLKALVHSPGDCDLKDKVRNLELQNAKNKGIFVTIGFAATAAAATISGIIVKVWK